MFCEECGTEAVLHFGIGCKYKACPNRGCSKHGLVINNIREYRCQQEAGLQIKN